MTETCGTCAFFEPITGTTGECRRHAPFAARRPTRVAQPWSNWPMVCLDDWCGQYESG